MKIFILLLFFLSAGNVTAKHYELFTLHHNIVVAHFDYDSIIPELREGDTIEFSNKKIFHLGKRLDTLAAITDQGSRTAIFEITNSPKEVIRISLQEFIRPGIRSTVNGYDELKYLGENIIKIIDSKDKEYVVVEKLPSKNYTFLDLILKDSIPEEVQIKMIKSLADFAKKTARFTELGDFHTTQMVYDIKNSRWVLFDWTEGHAYFDKNQFNLENDNIWNFSIRFYFEENIDENVRDMIPVMTSEQSEKLKNILELLNRVTKNERKLMLDTMETKIKKPCLSLMRSFL